jgi:hypothetical protein
VRVRTTACLPDNAYNQEGRRDAEVERRVGNSARENSKKFGHLLIETEFIIIKSAKFAVSIVALSLGLVNVVHVSII